MSDSQSIETDDFRSLGGPVGRQAEGARVDAYLADAFPFLSRSAWQKRLDTGEATVNGRKVRASHRLMSGDQLYFYHPLAREPEVSGDLELLYQDCGVACVAKPAGMPMHENGAYRTKTFKHRLWDLLGEEWAAVHRLDLETSGVVLCADSTGLRQKLHADFRAHRINKTYQALCRGVARETTWLADFPIGDLPESQIRIKKWVVAGGLPSQTRFRVLKQFTETCLLEAFPLTGRTNQIRIHAAYAGLPLIGDKLFYPDEEVFLEYFANGTTENVIKRTGHHRCCLHASEIGFQHPSLQQEFRVRCEVAPDIAELIEKDANGVKVVGFDQVPLRGDVQSTPTVITDT